MKDQNKTKEQLISELVKLRQRIDELESSEAKHKQTKKTLQATYKFLKIAFKHKEVIPLLKEFVAEVQNFTKCHAVGIRMLDEEGNIPYEAYEGFSKRFYESESPLSIKSDQCMCINVIKGETDPNLPFYSKSGSFYMNGTTCFLATVSEEEKGQTCNVCNEFGYESVALIPILMGHRILGLIHVADPLENMVPLEKVELLEGVAMQICTAIERVRREGKIKESLREKEVLLYEIHHRVKNNLQIISSLLDMSSMRIHDKKMLDLCKSVHTKIHTMALIHSQLHRTSRFDKIDMGSYIHEQVEHLSQIFTAKNRFITPIIDHSEVFLSINQAVPCALVLNEVISNAFKHAFKEMEKGTIGISIKKSAHDTVFIRVKDDGVGIPEEIDINKTDSLGLKLVRNLVRDQLKGKIQVKRIKGTEIIIEFKILK